METSSKKYGPPISVIICSRNRPVMLIESVQSILSGSMLPEELLIIDQSDSKNEELAELKLDDSCEVRYYWTRTVGLSRANNVGIASARQEILVFTHDDVRVSADWLEVLTRSLTNAGSRAVVTGRVMPEEAEQPGGFVASTKADPVPAVYRARTCAGVLYPMNMAMYRSTFDEIGLFDERLGPGTPFPAAEDNDLCDRLLRTGYSIHYVPDAVLYHRAWRSDRDYFPLRWAYGRGQGAFYGKHLSRRDRHALRCMRADVTHRTRGMLQGLRADRRRAGGEFVYLLGVASGLAQWLIAGLTSR